MLLRQTQGNKVQEQTTEKKKAQQDKVPQAEPINLNTAMKITALLRATRGNLQNNFPLELDKHLQNKLQNGSKQTG